MANEFLKASKIITNAINKATVDSLNYAALNGQTRFVADIQAATGLPKARINGRLFLNKATLQNPTASVAIGTKVGIDASYFSPQQIIVPVQRKGSSKISNYTGVTIQAGLSNREVVPNAFIGQAKGSGRITVFVRRGSKRLPLDKVYLNVLTNAAMAARPAAQQVMLDTFIALVPTQVQFQLGQQGDVSNA